MLLVDDARRELAKLIDWTQASCLGLAPNLFFPRTGDSTKEAKQVCSTCPIRVECLDYAVTAGEHHGIWGGASEKQRRQMRLARAC